MFNNRLTIDLNALQRAISNYESVITSFEDAVKDTEKGIEALKKSGWKSNASTAYFLTYEDTWKKNMKKRIKIIKHLKECLETAQKEYQAIYDEMEELDDVL